MYDWENLPLEGKKAKLEELKAKLAQAKASADYSAQRRGLQGAAEALMPYDPMGAFGLMDKREALDIKWKQAANSSSEKKAALDEIKAMTWSIQTTTNPAVKQQLSDNLEALNKQYLSKFGVTPEKDLEKDPTAWLSNYWSNIAIDSYGKNADGAIKDSSKLKSDIKIAAKAEGFSVLDKDIDTKIDGYNADAERAYNAKTDKQQSDINLARSTEEFNQTKYDNWLKRKLPGVDKVHDALNTLSQGFVSAKAQGERSPIGGAYIAMKKSLGDALSNSDFSGIAGFGVGQGLISKIKTAVGASAMTEAQAKQILTTAIQGYNDLVDAYNKDLSDKMSGEPQGSVNEASKAFKLNRVKLPTFTNNKDEAAGNSVLREHAPVKGGKVGDATYEVIE